MGHIIAAGINAQRFDTRPFRTDRHELNRLCALFNIGKLIRWAHKKDQLMAHSNFIVDATSNHGRYILKFHPVTTATSERIRQDIEREWKLSRLLLSRNVPAPSMLRNEKGLPYIVSGKHITTCYEFLDGHPAYGKPLTARRIAKITDSIALLDKSLADIKLIARLIGKETLADKLRPLVRAARTRPPVQNALNAFQRTHALTPELFVQRPVHANLTLANIFFCKDKAYILDLGHIRTDQELSGLANLVTSCIFLKTPGTMLRRLVQEHFKQHALKREKWPVLNSLVLLELAKEHIKIATRWQKIKSRALTARKDKDYRCHMKERLKELNALLNRKIDAKEYPIAE